MPHFLLCRGHSCKRPVFSHQRWSRPFCTPQAHSWLFGGPGLVRRAIKQINAISRGNSWYMCASGVEKGRKHIISFNSPYFRIMADDDTNSVGYKSWGRERHKEWGVADKCARSIVIILQRCHAMHPRCSCLYLRKRLRFSSPPLWNNTCRLSVLCLQLLYFRWYD